ncbi:MAG: HAMP domain-containing methyl-accepting chemotaxis protein [Halopseudomonas sp.]
MSIRQKLILSFTLLALLATLTGLYNISVIDGLNQQLNDSSDHASAVVNLLLIGLTLAVIGASLWWVLSTISQPIDRILSNLEQTEQGKLTASITVQRQDELGNVSDHINRFTSGLNETLVIVCDEMDRLSEHAQAMTGNSDRSNQMAKQQQQELAQLATAIHQLSQTVQAMTTHAEQASASAHQADNHSQQGNQLVTDAAAGINQLTSRVDHSMTEIESLQSQTQSIGSVLDVIHTIAEQTNLLALNAAIEAARAGESGRGFAVVADEVRSLAQRTQQSTAEIAASIELLQRGANSAVSTMSEVQQQAGQVAAQTNDAASALDQITAAAGSIRQMNQQIAMAAEQQSSVTIEVSGNVERLNQLSQQTADETLSTRQGCDEVQKLAQDVEQQLSRFELIKP